MFRTILAAVTAVVLAAPLTAAATPNDPATQDPNCTTAERDTVKTRIDGSFRLINRTITACNDGSSTTVVYRSRWYPSGTLDPTAG